MTKKYKNKFNLYKNCRSVYLFRKIHRTNKYRITNKIKNEYGKYVIYHKPCIVKTENLDAFISNIVYYEITSLGLSRNGKY